MSKRFQSFEGFKIEVTTEQLAGGVVKGQWKVIPETDVAKSQLAPADRFSMDADEFPGLSGSEAAERCFDAAKKFIRGVIDRASASGS
jgi:hypothetical protein